MFGIDESPTNFRQQTSQPQPHDQDKTPEGGESVMPEPLSHAERKRKQDETLKALIAQDLGHTTEHDEQSVSSSPVGADIASRMRGFVTSLLAHEDSPTSQAPLEPEDTNARLSVMDEPDGTGDLITLMSKDNDEDTTPETLDESTSDENSPDTRIPLSRDTLSEDDSHEDSSGRMSPVSPAIENILSDLPSPHDCGVEDTSGHRDQKIFSPAPPTVSTASRSSVRQFPPRRLLIIFTVLIVCVVLGFAGVHVFTQHVSHECTRVNSEYATKWNVYEKTLNSARSVEKSTGADAVADKATLTKLHALISKPLSKSKSLDCVVSLPSVFQVHDAVSHRSGETATLTDSTTTVETLCRK